MSARPPRRRPAYRIYVSESAREARRRRLQRRRTALIVVVAVVAIVGVVVGTGLARTAWRSVAGHDGGSGGGASHGGGSSSGGGAGTQTPAPAPGTPSPSATTAAPPIVAEGDGVKVSTFLGNETRRVYGLGPPPKKLDLIWKTVLGSGFTSPVGSGPNTPWSGSGWTGQPVILRDKGKLYLMASGFDHNLHKIELETGRVVWQYSFNDIIKSSPTVIEDPHPDSPKDKYLVLAGSRRGWPSSFTDPGLAPYRAVSFGTGKEVWRLPVPLTASYSRDVDGSGFFYNNHMFSGVESGWFYKLDPFKTKPWNGHRTPVVIASRLLLGEPADQSVHGGNLVLEASPSLLNGIVYISSGAGHIYGMRRSDLKVVWDYRTGSDLDGTPVPTTSGYLLAAVEKQYISGHGGVLCLDPEKKGSAAVRWFFPTGDRNLGDWLGGIIGSVAVNDAYDPLGRHPRLAAFNAIDGNCYVVAQDAKTGSKVRGPNGDGPYATPKQIASFYIGGSISTPIMVDDTIVTAGYDNKVHLYTVKWREAEQGQKGALKSPDGNWFTVSIKEKSVFSGGGSFESTPVMWQGRVFIGSRDGNLYCLGDK